MILTKGEAIKMWQEYTEKLQQNGLNDLDNQDGVVIYVRVRQPGV